MRYMQFFILCILVLEHLKNKEIIIVFDKRKLNKTLKSYFIENKHLLIKLK